jgi:hypothetical protein
MLPVARIRGMTICQRSASTPAMAQRQCVKMRWQLLVSGAGRARNEAADATSDLQPCLQMCVWCSSKKVRWLLDLVQGRRSWREGPRSDRLIARWINRQVGLCSLLAEDTSLAFAGWLVNC